MALYAEPNIARRRPVQPHLGLRWTTPRRRLRFKHAPEALHTTPEGRACLPAFSSGSVELAQATAHLEGSRVDRLDVYCRNVCVVDDARQADTYNKHNDTPPPQKIGAL